MKVNPSKVKPLPSLMPGPENRVSLNCCNHCEVPTWWRSPTHLHRHFTAVHQLHHCDRCHKIFSLVSRFRKHECLEYPDDVPEEPQQQPPVVEVPLEEWLNPPDISIKEPPQEGTLERCTSSGGVSVFERLGPVPPNTPCHDGSVMDMVLLTDEEGRQFLVPVQDAQPWNGDN